MQILNEEMDENEFPQLTKWAKRNKQSLEITLINSVEKMYGGNKGAVGSAMVMLEMDLQHQADSNS